MRLGILLAAMFLALVTVNAQEDWDKYKPRTLDEIVNQHSKLAPAAKGFLFTGDLFPSRVKVLYTAQQRPLNKERKYFISQFFKSVNHAELADLFISEFLFKEGSVQYWLPVQEQLIEHFKRELKSGDKAVLFVNWIGAYNRNGKVDWIFLVNEFESLNPVLAEFGGKGFVSLNRLCQLNAFRRCCTSP